MGALRGDKRMHNAGVWCPVIASDAERGQPGHVSPGLAGQADLRGGAGLRALPAGPAMARWR